MIEFGLFGCFICFMIVLYKCEVVSFLFSFFFKGEFFSNDDLDVEFFIIDSFFVLDMKKIFIIRFGKFFIDYKLIVLFV